MPVDFLQKQEGGRRTHRGGSTDAPLLRNGFY